MTGLSERWKTGHLQKTTASIPPRNARNTANVEPWDEGIIERIFSERPTFAQQVYQPYTMEQKSDVPKVIGGR
jgi:hypothetical protein